ncbi:MAG: transposase [Saprospiraceae bacterium]|jgi:transposase
MRMGFDGLSGLISNQMHRSPLDGRVYLFINRRRDRMKMLVWESGGFMLYYKRLEQGTFELPQST